ncbi:hypothetical protein NL676_005201 [Syzygium grande]|nr:hypothetical protein NL676_005201 [Syzygium grande]
MTSSTTRTRSRYPIVFFLSRAISAVVARGLSIFLGSFGFWFGPALPHLRPLAFFRRPQPAIALLDELRIRGLCPDAYTFSSLVKACGSVWENEIVHGVCLKYGFSASAYVVSGLVENYAGGGQVGAAEKCFEDCEGVDNVVWVAVVSGYVWNGEFDSAKELFVEMRGVGFELGGERV